MLPPTKTRPWTVQCIIDWLKVRENEGKNFPCSVIELEHEIDHSALLRRLIEGKTALPEPPPLSHGYPWYALMDEGEAEPYDVWEADDRTNETFGFKALVVDQYPWRILDKPAADNFIVTYGSSERKWRAWVTGISASASGASRPQWKLSLIP